MKRIVAALGCSVVVAASGCVVVVGSPLDRLGRERGLEEVTLAGEGRTKILLVDVTGVLSDTPTSRAFGLVEEESTLARIEAELAKAAEDARVRAVVLNVNSPGGGVTASDEIYTRLVRFKREQGVPVVAAIADTGASGGYYVACAADTIVAHPTSVTGSIGVILVNLNLEGLLGKLGVANQTLKAGAHKDLLSPLRAATPEERRIVQDILDSLHARFVAVVRGSRPTLDTARLGEITDGRIFGADRALDLGLVDRVGNLDDAIEIAKHAAHVEEVRVVRYRRRGEGRESLHARTFPQGVQVNLLPLDLGAGQQLGPRFLYLWTAASLPDSRAR